MLSRPYVLFRVTQGDHDPNANDKYSHCISQILKPAK